MSSYVVKRDFTYFAKVTIKVFGVSNMPIITWQSTQSSSMKLMTRANVSISILDIQRLNIIMVVAHSAMVGNTCISITLDNIVEICF